MASCDLVLTQLCHKKNNRWYSILQGQWDGYSILFSPSVFIGYLFKMEKVKQSYYGTWDEWSIYRLYGQSQTTLEVLYFNLQQNNATRLTSPGRMREFEEFMFTSGNVSDLALIGMLIISSPTPSTSTTSSSRYVLTVLAHNVTCTNV